MNISKYLLILLFVLSARVCIHAQEHKDSRGNLIPEKFLSPINLTLQNATLDSALILFTKTSGLNLNYNSEIISSQRKVTINDRNKPAIEVLRRILIGTGVEYIVVNDQVVLSQARSGRSNIPKHTVSGFVKDAETGESLLGTNIYIKELTTGCVTNKYGFYSITLPEGLYNSLYSYIGYQTRQMEIELDRNIRLDVELKKKAIVKDTIVVIGELENEIASTAMGTIELVPEKLNSIPILFGEQDLLKTLHLLPGVSSYKEGDAGIYVRGGNSDQNLLLLDEAPIFNAFHFFGFFSVFNSEAIRNVKLIKGPAPAKYGGRLSSVIDVQMKEGNLKKFEGVAGLGLIFSRLTLQGPIEKERGSYVVSGRRTYLDLFKYLSGDEDVINSSLYFYDFNVKANYILNESDRLYLSGYIGSDVMGLSDVVNVWWGNKTATLRWNHLFSDKLFLNTSVIYSNFTHSTKIDTDDNNPTKVEVLSKVNDFTLKGDFQYFLNTDHTFNFGVNYINHAFLPADIWVDSDDEYNIEIGKRFANEYSFYLSDEIKVTEKLKVDLGLRYSLFHVRGDKDLYDIGQFNPDIDFDFHEKEKKLYSGLEPRFSSVYMLDNNNSLKLAYSRNYQYLHMVSNSTSGTPLDVWQPVSNKVKPLMSDQISFGYFSSFHETDSEFSLELFYKQMDNLIDYRDGANLALRSYFESEYVFGEGRAYGMELFLKKKIGKITGWLGYTLSRSERRFDKINNGRYFPAKFDRTHDFSIVLMYEPSKKWKLSANWVYSTGNAITVPHGRYQLLGHTYEAYSSRNGFRIPAFHRLDLNVTYITDGNSSWSFSLYNAYGRKNTYTMLFRGSDIESGKEAMRISLFSIVPSITYTMRF